MRLCDECVAADDGAAARALGTAARFRQKIRMRILIVDDEPLALDRLEAFLADVAGAEVVGRATSAREAIAAAEALRPDLIVLDVQMPGGSGLGVATAMTYEARPEIVFVTAHEHFAPDAFEVDAADYVLKPVRLDRLRLAVDRARRRRFLLAQAGRVAALESENDALRREPAAPLPKGRLDFWVQGRRGQIRVPVAEVDWIEAAKDYVILHTATRGYIHRSTMAALEAELDAAELLRVHRSAFLRPSVVRELQRSGRSVSAVLRDGAVVQVGPSYLEELEQALAL